MTIAGNTVLFSLLLGAWAATPASAQQMDLTSARAARYRGQEGRRLTVVCQPGSKPERIWGTELYTDDSAICTAAAHAGIIKLAEGGRVTAVITGGRPSYRGSTRNGISSENFGEWSGSFTVEDADGGQLDWTTKAAGIANLRQPVALFCPAGGSTAGRVWGSDAYTADSPICIAAVHAGVITPDKGGKVVIEGAAGRASYGGTTRNGVTSLSFGAWPTSFRFEGAQSGAAQASAPAVAPAPPQPVSLRKITAPALELTGTSAAETIRRLEAPRISITGAASQKIDRTLTAPRLILQSQ